MREKIIKVYKFAELSEHIQDKVITDLYDINLDYEWAGYLTEDAKDIGLDITNICIEKNICEGKFTQSMVKVAQNIMLVHGEEASTYIAAREFLASFSLLGNGAVDEIAKQDLIDEFKHSLLEEYLIMFRKEYEYLTSRSAIEEMIEANDYEFTIEGKLA